MGDAEFAHGGDEEFEVYFVVFDEEDAEVFGLGGGGGGVGGWGVFFALVVGLC